MMRDEESGKEAEGRSETEHDRSNLFCPKDGTPLRKKEVVEDEKGDVVSVPSNFELHYCEREPAHWWQRIGRALIRLDEGRLSDIVANRIFLRYPEPPYIIHATHPAMTIPEPGTERPGKMMRKVLWDKGVWRLEWGDPPRDSAPMEKPSPEWAPLVEYLGHWEPRWGERPSVDETKMYRLFRKALREFEKEKSGPH